MLLGPGCQEGVGRALSQTHTLFGPLLNAATEIREERLEQPRNLHNVQKNAQQGTPQAVLMASWYAARIRTGYSVGTICKNLMLSCLSAEPQLIFPRPLVQFVENQVILK